jgi:hypothetical protein
MSFVKLAKPEGGARETHRLKGWLDSPESADTQIDSPMSHSGKTLLEGARQVFQLDVYTLIKFGLSLLLLHWCMWQER